MSNVKQDTMHCRRKLSSEVGKSFYLSHPPSYVKIVDLNAKFAGEPAILFAITEPGTYQYWALPGIKPGQSEEVSSDAATGGYYLFGKAYTTVKKLQ